MSKVKQFLTARKVAAMRKAVLENKMPEQGTFITLFNNNYKVMTKPDATICILEDNRSNKFAMSRNEVLKMLNPDNDMNKAEHYGAKPNKLVGHIGQNAKPGASSSGGKGANAQGGDPLGTVRNGRKKVVSKKTGQTMWVNIATGESHSDHQTEEKESHSKEAQQQADHFFDSLKGKLHASDTMKLQRQMTDLMGMKQKIQNAMAVAHQDDRQKAPEAQLSRKKVFELQDHYKKAFKDFQSSVKESAAKQKKESGNE